LIAAVHRRDELFEGPAIEKLPDLIFEFDGYSWVGKASLTRRTPIWDTIKIATAGNEMYVGTHRREGIFALAGPSATAGEVMGANIEDIAPTIFYLLGEPIPSDLEGRLLEAAIRPELLAGRPPVYTDVAGVVASGELQDYSAEELAEVEERLRDLGYLE
jgi:predicted AlkP superfamily phosphohydrolase/phosphomutase